MSLILFGGLPCHATNWMQTSLFYIGAATLAYKNLNSIGIILYTEQDAAKCFRLICPPIMLINLLLLFRLYDATRRYLSSSFMSRERSERLLVSRGWNMIMILFHPQCILFNFAIRLKFSLWESWLFSRGWNYSFYESVSDLIRGGVVMEKTLRRRKKRRMDWEY